MGNRRWGLFCELLATGSDGAGVFGLAGSSDSILQLGGAFCRAATGGKDFGFFDLQTGQLLTLHQRRQIGNIRHWAIQVDQRQSRQERKIGNSVVLKKQFRYLQPLERIQVGKSALAIGGAAVEGPQTCQASHRRLSVMLSVKNPNSVTAPWSILGGRCPLRSVRANASYISERVHPATEGIYGPRLSSAVQERSFRFPELLQSPLQQVLHDGHHLHEQWFLLLGGPSGLVMSDDDHVGFEVDLVPRQLAELTGRTPVSRQKIRTWRNRVSVFRSSARNSSGLKKRSRPSA